MFTKILQVSGGLVATLTLAGYAYASAILTVNATDVIYAAATQGSVATSAGGTAPTGIITLTGSASYITFSSVIGSLSSSDGNTCASSERCIVLNNGTGNNPNDPDGFGAVPTTSSETGFGSISGLIGPHAGYLVGVFLLRAVLRVRLRLP